MFNSITGCFKTARWGSEDPAEPHVVSLSARREARPPGFETASRPLPFVLVAILFFNSVSCAADDITLPAVLDFLRVRESQIADCVADITIEERVGPDFQEFWEAAADYNMYFSRFVGTPARRQAALSETHTRPAPTRHWRISVLAADHKMFEYFAGPPNADFENLILRECLVDSVWERYVPADYNGPRVFLADEPEGTKALAVLGLVFPDPVVCSTQLTELFAEHHATVRELETGNLELGFRMPSKESPELLNEITIEIDPKIGFAAVRGDCRSVLKGNTHPNFQSRGFKATWSDWHNTENMVPIARKLHITRWADRMLPRDRAAGFQPLVVDGETEMSMGVAMIDPNSYQMKTYAQGEEVHICTRLDSPSGLTEPLCISDYPEGTIVQDDRTMEVYQLTGAGPAVGNALSERLEPLLGARPVTSNPFRAILIVGNLSLLAVILFVIYRRRRKL